MPDALPLAPTVIDGGVSIVRLHGEACFDCGAVGKDLRAAGAVVICGSARVWQTVTCGCRRNAGQDWLLACAPNPADVQRAWDAGQLAGFPAGLRWRVAESRLLHSVEAVGWIGGNRIGPVLADVHRDTAWWLLPADLADGLDGIPRLTVRPPGWILECPPVLRSVDGRWWLERPDGSGQLTDPLLLGAAFRAGRARFPTEVTR
ncbi:hypothetical protein ACW4TU_18315 [Streptomyces sp. QTS52]